MKGKKVVPPDFMERMLSGKTFKTGTEATPERNRTDIGPVPEKQKARPTVVRLDPDDHEAVKREASRRGTSIAGVIRSLIREHLRGLR